MLLYFIIIIIYSYSATHFGRYPAATTEIEEVSFKWIKRESNAAAHALAKWGLANRWHGFIILSSLPDQVWHVFRKDAAGCINICS